LSCPPLAINFPSDEKWQHATLLVLARTEFTSENVKPENRTNHALSLWSVWHFLFMLMYIKELKSK